MGKLYLKDILDRDISITVDFKNLTSETAVISEIAMSGVSANGCVLKLPAKSCSDGHQVLLRLLVNKEEEGPPKSKRIDIIGKVMKLEPTAGTELEVTIQFNQFIKEEWKYILDSLERKQEIITQVMDKLKTTDKL
ncbi:hypothetical protein ACJVC5_16395 [Peredibacter sp. HCB2-198]|uniref:hypothetical protein n=1 Tax=Peredibacter sp. HCB2-198 TaxID=3383025 RepID=UPI0038B5257D